LAIGVVGCGSDEIATSPATEQLSIGEIIEQVNASGKITGTLIIRALNRRVMHL
jgi:hypothetical protein